MQRAAIRNWHHTQKLGLLSGYTGTLLPNGKIKRHRGRQPFVSMVAFTLRTLAEELGRDAEPLFNENGWKQFRDAVHIRDCLMHPKSMSDIEITAADMEVVISASDWYTSVAQPMLMQHKKIIEERTAASEKGGG